MLTYGELYLWLHSLCLLSSDHSNDSAWTIGQMYRETNANEIDKLTCASKCNLTKLGVPAVS